MSLQCLKNILLGNWWRWTLGMFPSKMAELAAETLDAKGAEVKLEIIPDLSHTYPREVNARVLDWFLA